MTPGPLPEVGSARYPFVVPPFALNVTFVPIGLRPPPNRVPQHADTLDLDLDDVADLHELRWLPRGADALGCAGGDDVTGPEIAARRELADQPRQLEHHEL